MKTLTARLLAKTGAFIMTALILSSCTSNWPQFRGAENNMIAQGKNLPVEWGEDSNIRWTADVEGDSWTSPITWGSKVFVASSLPVKVSAAPERREDGQEEGKDESFKSEVYRWEISCLDLESGEELWKQVAFEGSPRVKKHRAHNYAAETPVTDGKRLYAYFGMTGLYCYDLAGELLWEKDLGAYKTLYDWGTGSSPVIYNDILYVQVDNEENSFLVALEAASGDEIWKADRDEKTNYSTPMIWENSLRKELIVGGKTARSYDLITGEVLWELKVQGHYNIPGPVADSSRGESHKTDCFINTISIGRRFAGSFLLTPEAIANDGLLDVCMIRKLNLVQRLKILTMVPKGTHINDQKVDYYKTGKITVDFGKKVPYHVDGELYFDTTFEVSVIPSAVNIIYNPRGNHFFKNSK